MQRRPKLLLAPILLAISMAQPVPGQSPGLNALPEVEFSRLSQRDPNPLGEKALAIHPEQWKHGETEHFIYHFVNSYVVTPISVEAEFHYRVVAKELQREQAAGDTKSHIYVFERPADWQQFQTARPAGTVDRRDSFAGEPLYPAQSCLQIQRQPSWARNRSSCSSSILPGWDSRAG